ncbi:hypothetical protein NFI96_016327, partial [Prochilodus magdalenae]
FVNKVYQNAPPTLDPVGLEAIQHALQAHGQQLGSHERHIQQLTHSMRQVTQSMQPNLNTTPFGNSCSSFSTPSHRILVLPNPLCVNPPDWQGATMGYSCLGSSGEQLLLLCQGSVPAIDQMLAFHTLAAKSSWDEKALKVAYRQSLKI